MVRKLNSAVYFKHIGCQTGGSIILPSLHSFENWSVVNQFAKKLPKNIKETKNLCESVNLRWPHPVLTHLLYPVTWPGLYNPDRLQLFWSSIFLDCDFAGPATIFFIHNNTHALWIPISKKTYLAVRLRILQIILSSFLCLELLIQSVENLSNIIRYLFSILETVPTSCSAKWPQIL